MGRSQDIVTIEDYTPTANVGWTFTTPGIELTVASWTIPALTLQWTLINVVKYSVVESVSFTSEKQQSSKPILRPNDTILKWKFTKATESLDKKYFVKLYQGQSCSFSICQPPTIFSHAGRFSFLSLTRLELPSFEQSWVTFGSMSRFDRSFLFFLLPSSSNSVAKVPSKKVALQVLHIFIVTKLPRR